MPIDQRARAHMIQKLEDVLGDASYTLLDHLPPTGWGDIATVRDLDHVETRIVQRVDQQVADLGHRLDQLDAKIDHIVAKLDAKIDHVVAELDAKIDHVDAKIDLVAGALRSELQSELGGLETRLVEKMADSQRTMIVAFVAALATNSGLLFTILHLTRP